MALSLVAQERLNNILTALDEQMQKGENEAFQAALKYYNVLACFGTGGSGGSTDVSLLAKETTLTAVNNKIPALSGGAIPVVQPTTVLSKDHRVLTTDEVIPAGSYFIYLKVLIGDVTIDGVTYSSNEYLNFESCYPLKHAAINLVIPSGKSVRLVREF